MKTKFSAIKYITIQVPNGYDIISTSGRLLVRVRN